MVMNFMNFTFCAIDIGITQEEKKIILNEILNVPDKYYQGNEFRGCRILPVYNGGGVRGQREEVGDTSKGDFKYTDVEGFLKNSIKIFEKKIFSWMNPVGRLNVLRTKANLGLNVHMDTKADEIGTRQHKYRLVLNGNIDKLYFLDKDSNKIYVPDCYDSYVLDGSHVHSLDPSDQEKITLCVGSPWDGKPTNKYLNLIKNSPYKMKLSRPNYVEESWVDPHFKYTTRDS
jgi:hypothetical protein